MFLHHTLETAPKSVTLRRVRGTFSQTYRNSSGQLFLEACLRSLNRFLNTNFWYLHLQMAMPTVSGGLGRLNKQDDGDKGPEVRKGKGEQNRRPKRWRYSLLTAVHREGGKEKFRSKVNKDIRHQMPNEQEFRNESQWNKVIILWQSHSSGKMERILTFFSFTSFILWHPWISKSQVSRRLSPSWRGFSYLTDQVPVLGRYFIAAHAEMSREHQSHY